MLREEFISRVKGMLAKVYRIADELDAKGIRLEISGDSEGSSMRELIQRDLILYVLRFPSKERKTNQACTEYMNECLGRGLTSAEIDILAENARNVKMTTLSTVLPFFILLDREIGGNDFATTYFQVISIVSTGYLACQDQVSVGEHVLYYKCADACMKLIERTLHTKVDYDPLGHLDENQKKLVKLSVELEVLLQQDEREEWIQGTEKAIGTADITRRKRRSEENQEKTENQDKKINTKESDLVSFRELQSLIGLDKVKQQVRTMVNVHIVQKRCEELDISRAPISMHMVFTGNPGTGKTTVARLVGKIFKEAGLLSKGHLVEVSRADLVGKYVGHTADMVRDVFEKAKGGVLFIDEAYMLTREGGGFGQEALETLLKLMEDHRDDVVVIAAGYPDLMQEFLEANPGVRSRFPFVIEFDDYTGFQLYRIFCRFCQENEVELNHDVRVRVKRYCVSRISGNRHSNGNARDVRNLFERMLMNQANRLVGAEQLDRPYMCAFETEDIPDWAGNSFDGKEEKGTVIDFM